MLTSYRTRDVSHSVYQVLVGGHVVLWVASGEVSEQVLEVLGS